MAEIDAEPIVSSPKATGTDLERYYEIMRAHDLTELEIREGTSYVKLSRSTAAPVPLAVHVPVAAHPVAPPTTVPTKQYHPITSPLAGMFYRSPAPNAPSFVKEGDKVAHGDVLCIVEAMKVMNEIRSDRPGLIHKVLAENGKPVSAGQELFQLDAI